MYTDDEEGDRPQEAQVMYLQALEQTSNASLSPTVTDDEEEDEDQPLVDDYTTTPTTTDVLDASTTTTPDVLEASTTTTTDVLEAFTTTTADAGDAGEEELERFLAEGCGCTRTGGNPCSTLFSKEHYLHTRDDCRALSRSELDLVLLGEIMAGISSGQVTTAEKYRHVSGPRQLKSMAFYHHGQRICRNTFRHLHGIGKLYINY